MIEGLSNTLNGLREIIDKEKKEVALEKIVKPSIIDTVLEFDYSRIDTLPLSVLEKYLGALSQYFIFINRYVNQLSIGANAARTRYEHHLNQKVLEIKRTGITVKEKIMEAEGDQDIIELRNMVEKFEARVSVYKNIPDAIELMIQTVKKVYDARIKEKERAV